MIQKKSEEILIIAPFFAPNGAVGAKRFSFLSKLFDNKGYNVNIITLKNRYAQRMDSSLPYSGSVYKTSMFPGFPIKGNNIFKRIFVRLWTRSFCLMDNYSGWTIPLLIKGLIVIYRKHINKIIVTGPPFSPVFTGLLLSLLTKSRLIIDYRDPWTNASWNDKERYGNIFFKKFNIFLENIAVKHAKALVFSTHWMKKEFVNAMGKNIKSKCNVVYNGFNNKEDVENILLEKDKINIVYAGEFYGERSLRLLTEPLLKLIKESVISSKNCCLHIFGKLKTDDRVLIEKHNLKNIIKEHAPVSHDKIVKYLKGADILTLITGYRINYAVPYKFFDYLSVKRPVLSIVPESSAMNDLMVDMDCGEVGYINNVDSVTTALKKLIQGDRSYTFYGAEKYTWDNAAQKYCRIIEKI